MKDLKTPALIFFLIFASNVFSQNVIKSICEKAGNEIIKKIKKNHPPKKIRLQVLNFTLKNQYSDTVRTLAGTKITKELENYLSRKETGDFEILKFKAQIDELVAKGASKPDKAQNLNYYKDELESITPHFYISGNYLLSDDYSSLQLENIYITSNKQFTDYADIGAVSDLSVSVKDYEKFYLANIETVNTVSDLAKLITLQLKSQTNILNIELENFVYSKNGQTSKFSAFLSDELAKQLSGTGNYLVKRNITRGPSKIFNRVDRTPHILSGSFVETHNGKKLKITAYLTNSKTQTILAVANFYIDVNILKRDSIDFVPDNSPEAEIRKKNIEKDKKKDEFDINVWTNKGNQNVVYKEGEILQFSVFSAEPCYLRFIYINAEGEAALLLDNFKIEPSQTNREYKISKKFRCIPAFGQETLFISAKTCEPFEHINYRTMPFEDNTVLKIITDDLSGILEKNRRSFGEIKNCKQAEKVINFTTYAK